MTPVFKIMEHESTLQIISQETKNIPEITFAHSTSSESFTTEGGQTL